MGRRVVVVNTYKSKYETYKGPVAGPALVEWLAALGACYCGLRVRACVVMSVLVRIERIAWACICGLRGRACAVFNWCALLLPVVTHLIIIHPSSMGVVFGRHRRNAKTNEGEGPDSLPRVVAGL